MTNPALFWVCTYFDKSLPFRIVNLSCETFKKEMLPDQSQLKDTPESYLKDGVD